MPGGTNPIGNNIGGVEKTAATGTPLVQQDALGIDYNADGKGNGFNTPSLLGIFQLPPYYHNGACETLVCVVGNVRHRTANFTRPDVLGEPGRRDPRRAIPGDHRRQHAPAALAARRTACPPARSTWSRPTAWCCSGS